MTDQVVAVFIYATYLFLPGYLVLSAARVFQNRFLLSYSISISVLVFTLLPVTLFGGNIYLWVGILHVTIALLVFCANSLYKKRALRRSVTHEIKNTASNSWPVFGIFGLLAGFSLYHLFVGPYTEIPSDFWKQLSRVGIEFHSIEEGLTLSGSNPIYVIHAAVAHFLSTSPINLILSTTLVTSSIFLGSVYWFSLKILSVFELDVRYKVAGAMLASLLTLITFGTASFSYVRYYAYFPTILGFPLIYVSIYYFLDYLEEPFGQKWNLTFISSLIIVMALIHQQEALLAIIILAGISFVKSIRSFSPASTLTSVLSARTRISTLLFIALFIVVSVYAFSTQELRPWGQTSHVTDAGRYLHVFKGLPIDNPSFRLWDTLGLFGIIVYAWYIFKWKSLYKSDYLTAGMLVPLFTNFNPLYATIFLHFGDSSVLWRTAYLIPLSIAAATLLILTVSRVTKTRLDWKRAVEFSMIAFLAASLLPINIHGTFNRTSKIPSLIPVEGSSGAELWKDLIVTIEDIQKQQLVRRIVSDEITTFVLYAATRDQVFWWPEHEYFPKYKYEYIEDFLSSDFNYSLLVINHRNGRQTKSARYARHWPSNVLDIKRHYPEGIEEFIFQNPEYFKLLWQSADRHIMVYKMHSEDY